MKVNDLVKIYNDPIDGSHHVPEGVLGVVMRIQGRIAHVQFGSDSRQFMYRVGDLVSIDTSDELGHASN